MTLGSLCASALRTADVFARVAACEPQQIRGICDQLLEPLPSAGRYRDLPAGLEARLQAWLQCTPAGRRGQLLTAVLLQLLGSLEQRLTVLAPPSEFDLEWRELAERILRQAEQEVEAGSWDDDPFRKDLALLCLRLYPAASHVLIPGAGIPRRELLHRPAWPGTLRLLARGVGRLAPYIENHVHPRMLANFSEHGRRRCLQLVACLLRQMPTQRGLIGKSWYYDALLAGVSPHLAYLYAEPQRHGAIFLRLPATAEASANAAARSAHRRRLITEGSYQPCMVRMIWPAAALLASPYGQPEALGFQGPAK